MISTTFHRARLTLAAAVAIGTLTACATTTPVPSAEEAAGSAYFKKVGDWQIEVDPAFAGCFASAEHVDGTLTRIGLDSTDDTAYFLVGSTEWKSLEQGASYPVEITFGDESPWSGNATGGRLNNYSTLIMWVTLAQMEILFEEFISEPYVDVVYDGASIALFQLEGSAAVAEAIVACQEQFAAPARSTDPFAEKSPS